ncbi:MAG: rhamnulose-1-phosphate aldolase [Bacilli bacterium]|nr:rhamnulose-1-phosphate aldolase [Bacilli bacterium]
MSKVLSIDIGASSGRFIVLSYENGLFSSKEIYRFSNGMKTIKGHLRWDIDKIFENILEGLKITLTTYKDISSIGIDTWGVDYGLIDDNGKLIDLPIGYRDERNKLAARELLSKINYQQIYEESGIQYLDFNTIFQLYSDIKSGIKFETFLLIPDLLVYLLTGERRTEITNFSTTGLYNPTTRKVSKKLLDLIGLDESKISPFVYPSERIGVLKDSIVKELGIYPVDVVSVGSHDTASCVASVKLKENSAYISSGTWSLLGIELDEPNKSVEAFKANLTNEIGVEHKVRFLKNIMGMFIVQELKKDFEVLHPNLSFQDLQDEAATVTNNEIYVDINNDLFSKPGDMQKKYYEYLVKTRQYKNTLTNGEIIRSIYESMAFKYREEFERLKAVSKKDLNEIIVIGGGKNAKLLNQIIADTLDIKVKTGLGEATIYGNALAQFIYLKEFKNLDEARQKLALSYEEEEFLPQNVGIYEQKYSRYRNLIESRGFNMRVLEAKFVKQFIKLCDEGWKKGWHERNGGNLSYRMTEEEANSIKENFVESKWQDIGTEVPELANEYFLVTGSGRYMMNVKEYPESNICIIKVDRTGTKFMILWGLVDGGRPTSELPSHLMNLEVVKKRTNGKYRVVYHCHATNIIALTFVLPLSNEVFTRELWEMATECPVVFPSGVGVVPWMVPGGKDIAIATSKLMEKYDLAIWAHHGIFGTGEDFESTFGLVDTVEKSAEILVKVLSMTHEKRQTITRQNFEDLAADFKVTLDPETLKICK